MVISIFLKKAKKITKWGIALESLSLQNFQTCDIRVYSYQLLWNSTSITFQGDTDISILSRVAFKLKTYKAVILWIKVHIHEIFQRILLTMGNSCVNSNFSQLFPSIHSFSPVRWMCCWNMVMKSNCKCSVDTAGIQSIFESEHSDINCILPRSSQCSSIQHQTSSGMGHICIY